MDVEMLPAKLDTLTATFDAELHRWDEVAILSCLSDQDEPVKVKVYDSDDPEEFVHGLPFCFYGEFKEYAPKANRYNPKPEVELQFHARKWRKVKPYDKAGTIKYLKQAPGIKEGIARRLWTAFGPDAIQRVKDDPETVAKEIGGGFTVEKAKMASAHFKENDQLEAAFVDLGGLLDGRGFPHALPKKLIRDYNADAAAKVKKNPWLLLAYKSTGVSRVDKLYLDLGGNPAAIKRQAIILWHCLLTAGNSSGDVWQSEQAAREMLKGRIAGADVKFNKAVELGCRSGMIERRYDEELRLWLAEGKRAGQERFVAQKVSEMMALTN